MEKGIYIKEVNKHIQMAGNGFPEEFSIEYRKKDGSYGSKKRCRRRAYVPTGDKRKDLLPVLRILGIEVPLARLPTGDKRKDLSSVQRENRIAGTYKLEYYDNGNWKEFDVLIPLMVKFNGKIIDHRF